MQGAAISTGKSCRQYRSAKSLTFNLRQATGLLQGSEVHRLKYLAVELLRLGTVEGHAKQDEGVRQTLQATIVL